MNTTQLHQVVMNLVSNEPGEGARFDVHFPLLEQRQAAEPVAKAS